MVRANSGSGGGGLGLADRGIPLAIFDLGPRKCYPTSKLPTVVKIRWIGHCDVSAVLTVRGMGGHGWSIVFHYFNQGKKKARTRPHPEAFERCRSISESEVFLTLSAKLYKAKKTDENVEP